LIDIRRPEEWRNTGVAQGAARINMLHPGGPQGFSDAVLKQVNGNHDAPIGLICRTGNRTAQMQSELRGSGFTQVYNIKEGMSGSAAGPGWIRQGLPVVPCDNC
jgi:rhodanese-related sulfurtransferase